MSLTVTKDIRVYHSKEDLGGAVKYIKFEMLISYSISLLFMLSINVSLCI